MVKPTDYSEKLVMYPHHQAAVPQPSQIYEYWRTTVASEDMHICEIKMPRLSEDTVTLGVRPDPSQESGGHLKASVPVLSFRFAGLAELADAPDSKSGGRKVV